MTTSRSKYSTAPTYGMLRRPAPKKQEPAQGPYFPPAPGVPNAPHAQPGQNAAVPPMAGPYAPQQAAPYVPAQAGYAQQPGYPPRQPNFKQQAQPAMPMQPVPYPQQQPYAAQPLPQEYSIRVKGPRRDGWLSLLLLAVLPVLFVVTLLVASPILKIAFVALAVVSLFAMWMQHSFIPSARATLSLIYCALILVCAVSLFTSYTHRDRTTSANGGSQNPSTQSDRIAANNDPSALGAGGSVTEPPATPTPAPENGISSAAWLRLEQFFQFWTVNNLPNMLSLVSPNWATEQDKPDTALFLILSNRVPLDYAFEKISNTDADSSRTVTMTATIDKRNSRDPVKIRFQVVMLKINGEWFVDPNSLVSNDPVETPTASDGGSSDSNILVTPTPKPTAKPDSNTKLYYNTKGGKYYHSEAECPSVDSSYLPLKSFYYRDLNSTKYKNLLPCPRCNAPQRP